MEDASGVHTATATVRDIPLDPDAVLDATHSTNRAQNVTSSRDGTHKQPKVDKLIDAAPQNAPVAVATTSDSVSSSSSSASLQLAAGDFLETTEAQLAIVLLIALDVCATAVQMHQRDQQDVERLRGIIDASDARSFTNASAAAPEGSRGSLLLSLAMRLVESFTGFTIFFFLIELAVLIAAFRRHFFTHVGYVLDLGVVVAAICYEICAQSKALRLLGVLRVWRVFRLVNTLLERERRVHDATKDALEQEQLRALQLEIERQAARASLEREYASRESLERLLQSFKDEVETLKEALQIAAEAVAEADLRGAASAADNEYTQQQYAAYYAQQQGEHEGWSYAEEYAAQEAYEQQDASVDLASYDSSGSAVGVALGTDEDAAVSSEEIASQYVQQEGGELDVHAHAEVEEVNEQPRAAEVTEAAASGGDDDFADALEE